MKQKVVAVFTLILNYIDFFCPYSFM